MSRGVFTPEQMIAAEEAALADTNLACELLKEWQEYVAKCGRTPKEHKCSPGYALAVRTRQAIRRGVFTPEQLIALDEMKKADMQVAATEVASAEDVNAGSFPVPLRQEQRASANSPADGLGSITPPVQKRLRCASTSSNRSTSSGPSLQESRRRDL